MIIVHLLDPHMHNTQIMYTHTHARIHAHTHMHTYTHTQEVVQIDMKAPWYLFAQQPRDIILWITSVD